MARGIGLTAVCWGAILALAAAGAGMRGTGPTAGTLVLGLLLVLAPAGLALPAGQILVAPRWALEVIVSWAVLGALLLLVNPTGLGRPLAILLLLPPFFGACASPTLLLAAWRLPHHAVLLRRWGYWLAAFPVGLAALAALGALTLLTGSLFGLLFVVGGLLYYGSTARPATTMESRAVARSTSAPLSRAESVARSSLRPVSAPVARSHRVSAAPE